MMKRTYYFGWAVGFVLLGLLVTGVAVPGLLAQAPNPTPVVIDLTPQPTATAVPDEMAGDPHEPNDTAEAAVAVGWGSIRAALHARDADYFRLYLKAGQMVQVRTAATAGEATVVDTYLELWRDGQLLAANDDRSPADVASEIIFTADAEGWYLLRVSQGAVAPAAPGTTGLYDLHLALVEPTPVPSPTVTATPSSTATPMATATPIATPTAVSAQVATIPSASMGSLPSGHAQTGQGIVAPSTIGQPILTAPAATAVVTTTTGITDTAVYTPTIPLRRLGAAAPEAAPQVTSARVLVYYDANNNRQPEPGEGIANVSVLAVDGQGQQLARTFTNMQGEAVFTLTDAPIERVLVPFVSSWSARVRPGMVNEEIVLGLPAVRLPVFLPVAEGASE